MNKITIIGSGFSAAISKLVFSEYNPIIISCSNPYFLKKYYVRRKSIECNKFFLKKAFSYGVLKYELNNVLLHDRLSLGGHSNIWGGMIDTSYLTEKVINLLRESKIFLKNLNIYKNGYSSNNENIKQMCDENGDIFDTSKIFLNCENKFLHSFHIEKNKIKLKIINSKTKDFEIQYTEKLFIGVSLPQLLELLIRSGYINKNVDISLNEYGHRFKYSMQKKIKNYDLNEIIIVKYSFFKIIDHFFGTKTFKLLNTIKIPMYVDQLFTYHNNKLNLVIDINSNTIKSSSKKLFGDSIHYCNLSIDGININKYLSNISNNVYGVSMPFVKQKSPGPISGDIINNILKIDLNRLNN